MRIAVFTCDRYNWLIPIFWHFYKKNWSDNPYLTDIVTEKSEIFFYDRIFYGGNSSWATTALNYLKQVDDEIIMLILDDYIIKGVNTEQIKLCEEECKKPDVGYIIVANREHDFMNKEAIPYNDNFLEYPKDKPYSLCLQVGIWKRDFLIDLLREGESVWQTEIEGSKRMVNKDKKVLLAKDYGINYVPGGCMRRGNETVKPVFDWIKENW